MYMLYRTDPDDTDAYMLRSVDANRAMFVRTKFIPQALKEIQLYGWQWDNDEASQRLTPAYTFNSLDDIPELFI